MTEHQGLPVHGYRPQPDEAVQLVNENKVLEEGVLRRLDQLVALGTADPRWMALARTQIEIGFMSLNRAIFRPERVK